MKSWGIMLPASVQFFVSDDNKTWTSVGTAKPASDVINATDESKNGAYVLTVESNSPVSGR